MARSSFSPYYIPVKTPDDPSQAPSRRNRPVAGWCVYIIECESGAWYTGVTNDLARRFRTHALGKGAKYFRMDKPKRIVAVRACDTRGEALKLEAANKKLGRADKRRWIRQNPYRHKAVAEK